MATPEECFTELEFLEKYAQRIRGGQRDVARNRDKHAVQCLRKDAASRENTLGLPQRQLRWTSTVQCGQLFKNECKTQEEKRKKIADQVRGHCTCAVVGSEHDEGKGQVEEMGPGLGKPDDSDCGRFQSGGKLVEWKVEKNNQKFRTEVQKNQNSLDTTYGR